MSQTAIALDTIVKRTDEQVGADLDGQVVLLSIEQGEYYSLDEVGSDIWTFLEEPIRVGALCDRLVERYEVDRETCEHDVLAFLGRMQDFKLVQVVDAQTA